MVETDWRKILNLSQKDLSRVDKEALCESLAWMEADDIEINFSDLKTLFRLAQDILKFKGEQVNNLRGEIETLQSKNAKINQHLTPEEESPVKSTDDSFNNAAHQEELIKSNKGLLEQQNVDITKHKKRKNNLEEKDSDSSRDALSEIDAITQLENEISMKNYHLRKLLVDFKVLEEENERLKSKVIVLKDKLKEATHIIEKLTKEICSTNFNISQIKEILANTEEEKCMLVAEIQHLKNQLEKEPVNDEQYELFRTKILHWKNIARSLKSQNDKISNENSKLRQELNQEKNEIPSTNLTLSHLNDTQNMQITKLKNKLFEASNQIIQSARIIDLLKTENQQLKSTLEETPESGSYIISESDKEKEKDLIKKLKENIHSLTCALQNAEELLLDREKDITEISAHLSLIENGDEGLNDLLSELKSKKRHIKLKDEAIKSFVKEINLLNRMIDDLQLENKIMKDQLNISTNEKIPTRGVLKKFQEVEINASRLSKKVFKLENELTSLQIENRSKNDLINKLKGVLRRVGTEDIDLEYNSDPNDVDLMPEDGGGDSSTLIASRKPKTQKIEPNISDSTMKAVIDENEGLRKGLKEVLEFLKGNNLVSTSASITMQCPSLEAVLTSMEARHAAGWFAPHMSAILELRSAIGSRDAILNVLHDARKETLNIMKELSLESQKSVTLEEKLIELEKENKKLHELSKNTLTAETDENSFDYRVFGNWMLNRDVSKIDLSDKMQVENIVTNSNILYRNRLKEALTYFNKQFNVLYNKMTEIAIQTSDEENRWAIQEEKYKAEIENLKIQLTPKNNSEESDNSAGLIDLPNINVLERKCAYLEESYRYVRTLNENLKNESLEVKRNVMIITSEYENQLQTLILSIISLTDKLRNSVPLELFIKQNEEFNITNVKYRQLLERCSKINTEDVNINKKLEENRSFLAQTILTQLKGNKCLQSEDKSNVMLLTEHSILLKQLEFTCESLNECKNKLTELEKINAELQFSQNKFFDFTLAHATKEEYDLLKAQVEHLITENKTLKIQCQHVESQLDIALLQLQDQQQKQVSKEMEINMLRHQILDLQSTNDNKAIIARLSGEILVSHLHASDNRKEIERLSLLIHKEKQRRLDAEEMLKAREKVFHVYAARYESRFRHIIEILQTLRQQYQGSIPLTSIENYINNITEAEKKNMSIEEKLNELEDLKSLLMAKEELLSGILINTKNKCITEEDNCPHLLQLSIQVGLHIQEIDHYKKKNRVLDEYKDAMIKRCTSLERILILVNQGFDKPPLQNVFHKNEIAKAVPDLHLEEVHSDDDGTSRKSQTITLTKPNILKNPTQNTEQKQVGPESHDVGDLSLPGSPSKLQQPEQKKVVEVSNVFVQTVSNVVQTKCKLTQTIQPKSEEKLKSQIEQLKQDNNKKDKEIVESLLISNKKSEEILRLNTMNNDLELRIKKLEDSMSYKNESIANLKKTLEHKTTELETQKEKQTVEKTVRKEDPEEEPNYLLNAIKNFENDKKALVNEYKAILQRDRNEFETVTKELQEKISDLQSQLNKKLEESFDKETTKGAHDEKYALKIVELEDQCFKLQSELDSCSNTITMSRNELERWKLLAAERLTKMEQLHNQLEERHCHEVESYKTESQHWLSQLNASEREHNELRSKLSEQRTAHARQLAEKDALIDQLKQTVNNLKGQIISMQAMISVNDPSFDLSAIVEVEEPSEAASQPDQLELKFDNSFEEFAGDTDSRLPASSTSIWQETIVERLRREKQLASKQNSVLRRQIKALAARERRARLEAQNLKNQIYRVSTSGTRTVTAESAALQNKIASLQAQLFSARRDNQSSVALWDKWKRAQQAAERWQARYEEKCQEVKKCEISLSHATSAIARLEREKRILLSKLAEMKNERQMSLVKMEDHTKHSFVIPELLENSVPSHVSTQSLLDRIEAQQRRIAALELAEKGNEPLVTEYEKSLAEITALRGQVLKLESTLLETQIRNPMKSSPDPQPEVHYWKSYCEMLKEENLQLSLRVSAMEATPGSGNQRTGDLERTVLTLRGVVSKLQAEQKSGLKRGDSRPSSSRSITEKGRSQLESYRTEIANLKRTIADKDALLEKSKDMLKMAAEREEQLLQENEFLRRRIDELTTSKSGYISA